MCDYSFNATAWNKTHVLESPVTGVWSCPHTSYKNSNYCIFHLDEEERSRLNISADEVQECLNKKIEQPGYDAKQFIGANLPKLEFPAETVESEDEAAINFGHATINGFVDFGAAAFEQDLVLSHTRISGIDAMDATFTSRVYFSGAKFINDADFSRCQFEDISNFQGAQFEGGVTFVATEFTNPSFKGAVFQNSPNFFSAELGDMADFSQCYLKNANFSNCQADGSVMFKGTVIKNRVDLDGFECEKVYLGFYSSETAFVNLMGAKLPKFTLSFQSKPDLLYNVMLSTLGDGSLKSETNDINPFRYIFMRDVSFDGFDFTSYHDELEDLDWKIHTYPDEFSSIIGRESEIDTEHFESTYLKAKLGAEKVGDNRAVSEFFLRELRYRRQRYWERGEYSDALFNFSYDIIAGYGERTSRVVMSSLISVVIFAEIYGLLISSDSSTLDHILLSYTTSLQAFVSLIFGGGSELESPIIRLLAGAEGFFGAFLIALFVYSLTQSARR